MLNFPNLISSFINANYSSRLNYSQASISFAALHILKLLIGDKMLYQI